MRDRLRNRNRDRPWRRLRRLPADFRRAVACARGVAALEFAFAAPVVLLGIFGALEFAMVMLVTTLMEGGLREASRFGTTGNVPAGSTREEYILQLIRSSTSGLVDMSTINVSYKVYPSFGDVGKPEPYTDSNPANGTYDAGEAYTDINGNGQWDADMGMAGLGGPGDVVLYIVEYDWEILTPIVSHILGEDGVMKLQSSVAVRNEPYPDPGGG